MDFGKKINELRKSKNITQDELAAELGVTAAAVSKWENGYTLPDILMLCALADYFQVTTDELLGRNVPIKYAVIAAETEELGQKIALLAKQEGFTSKGIFTSYMDALNAGLADSSVGYILAGYHKDLSKEEDEADCKHLRKCICICDSSDQVALDTLQKVLKNFDIYSGLAK